MNSKKLMKILTSRNREEMTFIRQTYRNLYNHDIVHHLCRTQRNNNLAVSTSNIYNANFLICLILSSFYMLYLIDDPISDDRLLENQ